MKPQHERPQNGLPTTSLTEATTEAIDACREATQMAGGRPDDARPEPMVRVGGRGWRTMRLTTVTVSACVLAIELGTPGQGFAQPIAPHSHNARAQDPLVRRQLGLRPLTGAIVRSYSPPAQRWLAGHRGIDIAGDIGATVRAPAAGVVRFAGQVAGVPILSITHVNGLVSTFQPVVAEVAAGHAVVRGQVIGTLASGDHCSRPCLHLGVKDAHGYRHPYLALRIWPRLLPWDERD